MHYLADLIFYVDNGEGDDNLSLVRKHNFLDLRTKDESH